MHVSISIYLQTLHSKLTVRSFVLSAIYSVPNIHIFFSTFFCSQIFRIIRKRIINALHIFETSCELWELMLLQYILPNNEFQLSKMMDDNVLRWNLEIFHIPKFCFLGFFIINRKIEYCLLSRNELSRFKLSS